MFEKALVATSLSDVSTCAAACFGGVRQMGVEQIVLVHALNTRHSNLLKQQLLSLSAREMEKQKALLEDAGFRVELEMPMGIPQYEINRVAAERQASLIVVYSTAESLFGDVFSGAVAYEVINQATVPVLVMKARMSEEQCEVVCPNLMARILFATDFSDTAKKAFQAVEHLVRNGCASVTLTHVQDKARIEPYLTERLAEFNRTDKSRLLELEKKLRELGATRVDIQMPYGSPAEELLRISRENEEPHTLVVMGTQGRGFIKELFLGSVSHFLVRRAPAPVLLVPAAPP